MSDYKCRICGNRFDNELYKPREKMYGHGDLFEYIHCRNCGVLQIKDYPTNLSEHYGDDYYSYQEISSKGFVKKNLARFRDNYALFGNSLLGRFLYNIYPREDLRSLSRLSITEDTRILDVGCGSGDLLYSLHEMGFRNLLGVDPYNPKTIQYKNGLIIKNVEIETIESKWNVVMLHHSFEHMPNPAKNLNTISNLLVPGGHCIIRIPTTSSYAWRHYRTNWVQLDAPRHLYLHSIESIKRLANQSDLTLKWKTYDSSAFQFWGSEQYLKGIPLRDARSFSENPKKSPFTKKEIAAFTRRANVLNSNNQGDQVVLYFEKHAELQ